MVAVPGAASLHCSTDQALSGVYSVAVHVCGLTYVQVDGVVHGDLWVERGATVGLVGRAAGRTLHNNGVVYVSGSASFEAVEGSGRIVLLPDCTWQEQPVQTRQTLMASDFASAAVDHRP